MSDNGEGVDVQESTYRPTSIADARRFAGLTQEQLAEKVGVDRVTVSCWERGVSGPQLLMRSRLAKALGVTSSELAKFLTKLSGEGQPGETCKALLAREIRRVRTELGLSQKNVAELIGYTREYVAMAERQGGNLPSGDLVRALDSALQADGNLIVLREKARTEQRMQRQKIVSTAAAQCDLGRRVVIMKTATA